MSISKLLLADDSVTIQKVVNLTFADEGIEVISVGDGDSAMKKFIEVSPDLVMADVNMPGIDGYRICEMIKQDEKTKDIPVVLLVGSFEPFDEDEAQRVGANDYLTKPFQSIRQLVEKVSGLLNKSEVERVAFAKPKVTQNETVKAGTGASVEIIEPTQEKSTDENKFGDAGMDDEMIQTNQIGSLPVDEAQKFESSTPDTSQSEDIQGQLRSPTYERTETSEGASETQPLSPAELNKITAEAIEEYPVKEEIIYEPADELEIIEEKTEVEAKAKSPDAEDEFVPTMIPTDQYFQPEEVAEEEPISVEEIPQEKGFAFQEDSEVKDISANETVREFEILNDESEVVVESSPESQTKSEQGKSQPGFIDKLRNIFSDKEETETVETQVAEEPIEFVQEVTEAETTAEESTSVRDTSENWKASIAEIDREIQQEKAAEIETATPQVEFESETPQPEILETEQVEVQFDTTEPIQETVQTEVVEEDEPETAETFEAKVEPAEPVQTEPAQELEVVSDSDEESSAEPEAIFEAEQAQAEAPTEIPDVIDLEEEIPEVKHETVEEKPVATQEAIADEVVEQEKPKIQERQIIDLDEANLLEIAPGEKLLPIKSMISSELREEKPEPGEGLIVSEYARQSISLSSEAIDMIADRVADKIAEKVIKQLSSEVISDLADMVVERMERKQLK